MVIVEMNSLLWGLENFLQNQNTKITNDLGCWALLWIGEIGLF
jgi:hypothetical protein